jgi:hypothetical protein
VFLSRGNQTIVAQVTVTSRVEYEVERIRRLLQGGFAHIAMVSVNRKKLNLIQQALSAEARLSDGVGFYSPEEFISKLYIWAGDDPEGGDIERGKPRRRKFDFRAGQISEPERKAREHEMLRSIAEAMKRKPTA